MNKVQDLVLTNGNGTDMDAKDRRTSMVSTGPMGKSLLKFLIIPIASNYDFALLKIVSRHIYNIVSSTLCKHIQQS